MLHIDWEKGLDSEILPEKYADAHSLSVHTGRIIDIFKQTYMSRWLIDEDCFWSSWWHHISCNHIVDMLGLIKNNIRFAIKDMIILGLCMALYVLNEIWFKAATTSLKWFFTGYYNDLLASPLLISYSNILLIIFLKKPYFNFIGLSIFILLAGVYWEYVTPLYKTSTPDPYDILMYYLGFIVYWIVRTTLRA
ncbi:hypothetical protein D3C73_659200 [compost metagenome]